MYNIPISKNCLNIVKNNSNEGIVRFIDENYVEEKGMLVCEKSDLDGVSDNLNEVIRAGLAELRKIVENL